LITATKDAPKELSFHSKDTTSHPLSRPDGICIKPLAEYVFFKKIHIFAANFKQQLNP